jgi:IS5 family transposase
MARRRIGQDAFAFVQGERGRNGRLDAIAVMLDRAPIERLLQDIHAAAKGEPAWPPLALFKALLLGLWHDLSDVALAEALDDRASFRRFCGFSSSEAVPERTAFVRFRKAPVERRLDEVLLGAVVGQLEPQGLAVRTGTPAHRSQSTGNIGKPRSQSKLDCGESPSNQPRVGSDCWVSTYPPPALSP